MVSINDLLMQRKSELQDLLSQVETMLKEAPEGRLRISHTKGRPSFYHCRSSGAKAKTYSGQYLRRDELSLIKALAQKGYCQQMKQEIKKQLVWLDRHTPDLSDLPLLEIYSRQSADRKPLITPLLEDDASFIERWQNITYEKRIFPIDSPEYITEKGERVLSKSEKILADKFFRMNIPYHYEKPLLLPGFGKIHPDFTLLNVRTREEFYWEHLGMLDNPSYAEENVRRINAYIKAGILPGSQLLLTWETKNTPLDWRVVERLINSFLI